MELVHELLGSWLGRTELLTLPIVSHTTTQLVPIDKGTKQVRNTHAASANHACACCIAFA